MRRSTAIQKQHSQLNKLSLNNLIRHSTKPVSVADVHLPHLTLTFQRRVRVPAGTFVCAERMLAAMGNLPINPIQNTSKNGAKTVELCLTSKSFYHTIIVYVNQNKELRKWYFRA